METTKKVNIIYRENDSFSKHMPLITKTFNKLGIDIYTKSFPKETESSEINTWIGKSTSKEELSDGMILTDETTLNEIHNVNRVTHGGLYVGHYRANILDDLLTTAYSAAICEKSDTPLTDREDCTHPLLGRSPTIENSSNLFSHLFKKVQEKDGTPKNIYIVKKHIADHYGTNTDLKSFTPEKEEYVANKFGSMLSGINGLEGMINYVDEITEDIDKNGNWILVDRHNSGEFTGYESIKHANTIIVPATNLLDKLKEENYLDVSEKDFETGLTNTLNLYYENYLDHLD